MEEYLPIYEALINDDGDGIEKISLCAYPATETNFLAFSDDRKKQRYSIVDEEKRHIISPIMRANFKIYRNDDGYEYYVIYSPETLQKMAIKMLSDGTQNNFNVEHKSNTNIDGIYLIQLFIKNTRAGIAPFGFDNIEEGSLFGEYYIEDDDTWEQVKNGTFKGISLEGVFSLKKMNEEEYQAKKVIEEMEYEHIQKMIRKNILKRL